MCIMIYCPNAQQFPIASVPDFFRSNHDGIGAMFAEGGKVHTAKALPLKSVDATDFCKGAMARAGKGPMVIHFRFATHGSVSIANTHPFMVRDNLALMHNGVLGIDTADGETDTVAYIDQYLRPIIGKARNPIAMLNGPLGEIIGAHIVGSKFALMDVKGKVALVNEGDGHWIGGVWYSNLQWRPWVRAASKHTKRGLPLDGNRENWDYWGRAYG